GEFLNKELQGKEQFIINRSFDVPMNVMFDMWTKPEHFSKWLPPTGFDMKFIRSDIRPGGSTFYMMSGQNFKMYGSAHYKEITSPNRIVYTQDFRDENENISRHPMAPTWPEAMLTTVTLTEEGPEQTRVTVCWETYGNVTPEELATFVKEKAGMTMGWTGSFDKLESYIEKLG
ncbi:MAG: SRPBCC family protein, partial [Pseudobdellovibrio sp.]